MMKNGVSGSNFPARADILSTVGYPTEHINPAAFRWNAITSVTISGTTYQALTFWNSAGKLVIGKRILDGAWTLYTYDGSGGLANITITGGDNHFISSIGIDPDGFIHVCYDMHGTALKYRKSDASITSWTGALTVALSMVGTNEGGVTYPTFFNDPAGNLYFIFRDETGGAIANLYMYKYTHGTTSWAAAAGTSTAGLFFTGTYPTPIDYAYWGRPCFDSNFGSGGFMHLAFKHRVSTTENADISYVKWDGTNWKQAGGAAQTIPITHINCEIVDDTNADVGMAAFPIVYSDSNGYPHIVYSKTGGDSSRHMYHIYYNGSWSSPTQLTTSANPVRGDNDIGMIGLVPEVAIDRTTDTVYVIYTNPMEQGGIQLLKSTNFTTWIRKLVYPYNVGWWEPKYDYIEFLRSGNIYLSLEYFRGIVTAGEESTFPIYILKMAPGTLI